MPDASAPPASGNDWRLSRRASRSVDPWVWLLERIAGRLRVGHGAITLPDGRVLRTEGVQPPSLRASIDIVRSRAIRRLILRRAAGVAEAYADGDWRSADLAGCLEFAARNEAALGAMAGGCPLMRLIRRLRHERRANTRRGSRSNVAAHYDLGNDFYRMWLDDGMTYSAALFDGADEGLGSARCRKYARIADALDLRKGLEVLEIGCGWGAFALLAAAEYGCRVTALTLSREQAAFVRERVRAAELADLVDVRLQDYRDGQGRFDRIVSIEMLEAVGEAYWPLFFAILRDRLRPGGRAVLQVITIDDRRFARYRRSADFIQSHVFPGGMLPSPAALAREVGRAGLAITRPVHLRRQLCAHAGSLAGAFQRRVAASKGPGLRRAVRPAVGVLSGLLRSRLPRWRDRRLPDWGRASALNEQAAQEPRTRPACVATLRAVIPDAWPDGHDPYHVAGFGRRLADHQPPGRRRGDEGGVGPAKERVGAGQVTMKPEDFAEATPQLLIENYFLGTTRAHGLFQDRSGELRRQFAVVIHGDGDGRELLLDETFAYDDGERHHRVWRITKLDAHSYEGRADDVIGAAAGRAYGNALNWRYDLGLKVRGDTWRVTLDDWLFLQADNVLISRARALKWGVRVGDVTVVFSKPLNGVRVPLLIPRFGGRTDPHV